jgi:hypothetical protein
MAITPRASIFLSGFVDELHPKLFMAYASRHGTNLE